MLIELSEAGARMVPVERAVGAVEGAAIAAALGGNLLTLASRYVMMETTWGNGYRGLATTTAECFGSVEGLRPAVVRVRLDAPERERLGRRGERIVVEAEIDVVLLTEQSEAG